MELSIGIEFLYRTLNPKQIRPLEQRVRMCRDAGFRRIDVGFTHGRDEGNFLFDDDWREQAHRLRETAERMGVRIDQTHAPFRFNLYEPQFYRRLMQNAFEASVILGTQTIVVHGDTYEKGDGPYDPQAALKTVGEYYMPYVEYGVNHGLIVCFENLFDTPKPRYRFCSRMEELKALLDYYDDPRVGACWDVGHAQVEYGDDLTKAVRLLDGRVRATHIHDNYFGKDLHLCPFLGGMNWKNIMAALRDSGYPGTLTLELVYGTMPDALMQQYLCLCRQAGETLLDTI